MKNLNSDNSTQMTMGKDRRSRQERIVHLMKKSSYITNAFSNNGHTNEAKKTNRTLQKSYTAPKGIPKLNLTNLHSYEHFLSNDT